MSITKNNQTPIKKYYSINELTALGIGSRTKIDRLSKKGLLKKIKIGGSVRFSGDEVNNFINSSNA
ncbi:TPA: helix-turn-helix domain-containing protein [Pasteurella multocida]|uniref:helix-turn-helix domain-containing protein n=1 Tax=Pasteurella multocida TaxID=747 RepID=UPI00145A1E85|nr:helix-turn-helix domain-containing protein [Pasteurella multocida]NMK16092.1 helix-turn-helix domain-containing protein [Pasteurella multocida]NMR59472.1 helix-turn-helix domain-containing protein [Pasteurella multocida]URH75477.1 helix-turn-helix domain-containing protein [Pasteurella multocida]URH89408.1 helix-turn-helix domain-containing protein [Pasteurella multocida]HDR1029192.1 helix-turn-helix domain-containing protein [Pasteurella multocida]